MNVSTPVPTALQPRRGDLLVLTIVAVLLTALVSALGTAPLIWESEQIAQPRVVGPIS